LVRDVLVQLRRLPNRFPAIPAALLLAGDGSLCPAQLLFRGAVEPGRFHSLPIAGDQERLQAQVDTDRGSRRRLDLCIRQLARENHMPAVRLAGEGDRLDAALYRPVELDLDRADVLEG